MRLGVLALSGLISSVCCGQGLRPLRRRASVSGGYYPSVSSAWNTTSSSTTSPEVPYSTQSYSFAPTTTEPGTSSTYSTSKDSAGTGSPTSYGTGVTGYSTSHGPISTGTSPSSPTNSLSSNSSSGLCSGKTLNVLGASLDWWYTRTLYNVVSTISIQFNSNDTQTGWTLLPATTPFDLASALASPTCTSSLTYNTYWNTSLYDVECAPAPTPVAAGTTVITQIAYQPVTATTGTGALPDVIETPPPATISVPSSGGSYAEGTAFVYFSAYEVMTKVQAQNANGSAGCTETTNTYAMATPFSFEYADGNVNGSKAVGEGVVGDVNPAFLDVVGLSRVEAGSWVAAPTVALVVQDIFVAEAVLAAVQGPKLTTQTSLLTPEPTLPSGFTPPPNEPTGKPLPTIGFTGHVESTAPSLALPTSMKTTQPGGSPPTNGPAPVQQPTDNGPPSVQQPTDNGPPSVQQPTNNGPAPVQQPTNNGPAPVQQPTGNGNPIPTNPGGTSPNGGSPTNIGGIAGVITSLATPTNAAEVLQQAEQTFEHTNPTAAAIIHGVSGPNPTPVGDSPGAVAPARGAPNQNDGVATAPNGTPLVVVGGTTFTADSETLFSLGPTATLTPGSAVVVAGTTVSLDSGLSAVVVNGQTHGASGPVVTPAPVLTIGGTTFAPTGGSTYNIAGQTLTPGGIINVGGTTVSLGMGASSIVVNGLTQNLMTTQQASITAPPALTIGTETFTAINNRGTYVVDGETLTPGGLETVYIDGKTYIISLASDATVVVIETVGPNGKVTATTVETLVSTQGSQATLTNTVGVTATAGSKPTSYPSPTVTPKLANGAASFNFGLAWICISLGTIALAFWL